MRDDIWFDVLSPLYRVRHSLANQRLGLLRIDHHGGMKSDCLLDGNSFNRPEQLPGVIAYRLVSGPKSPAMAALNPASGTSTPFSLITSSPSMVCARTALPRPSRA